MLQNLFDHLALIPLDERDDFHFRTTLGAAERIRLVNLLDEGRPALAGLPGAGPTGRRCAPLRCRRLRLGPLPPLLIRLPPVIPDQVLSGIWYVLGDFGEEVQRIEDLEVALRTGEQIIAGRLRISPQPIACLAEA